MTTPNILKRNAFLLLAPSATVLAFQNCSGSNTSFSVEDPASLGTESSQQPVDNQRGADAVALANKQLSFSGTRVNRQLALVAQISQPTAVSLTITLTKSCGSLVDSQILGNGSMGQFVFSIPAGQMMSQPVVLSNFPNGQIVWKVSTNITGTPRIVTDLIQTCSPWLQSGGEALCPAPNNQPYCVDRGQ